MSVSVKWVPLSALNTDHYNIYRSDAQTGPFVVVGNLPQPSGPLPAQLQFLDPTGDLTKWYVIEPVDTDNIPGISTSAFQATSDAILMRVWDVIQDAARRPIVGLRVEARLSAAAFFNNLIVPQNVLTVTDANGYWFLDLFPNSVLSPNTTDYTFIIPGVQPAKRGVVPVGLTIAFKDVVGP